MNALLQPDDQHIPPPLPNGNFRAEHSRVALGRGHEGAISFVPTPSQHDDRAPQRFVADKGEAARNWRQAAGNSGNIDGAHSAIESSQEREAETEQENSLSNSLDDDGLSVAARERHARCDRIIESIREHFKSCLAEWQWEHYLCGATCALMTYLLVLELF